MKKKIIDTLYIMGQVHGIHSVFDDFLQISVCVFAMGKFDEEYFKRIKKYNSEELKQFAFLLSQTILLFEKEIGFNNWCDFLGDILEEIGLSNQHNGQFLTPSGICSLMASIHGDMNDKTVLDPSVGTGRTILAILSKENNVPKYVEGIDIDLRACNISVINLLFHGLRGRIIWGDSLCLKTFRVYEINMNVKQPIKVITNSNYLLEQQNKCSKIDFKQSTVLDYGNLFS